MEIDRQAGLIVKTHNNVEYTTTAGAPRGNSEWVACYQERGVDWKTDWIVLRSLYSLSEQAQDGKSEKSFHRVGRKIFHRVSVNGWSKKSIERFFKEWKIQLVNDKLLEKIYFINENAMSD